MDRSFPLRKAAAALASVMDGTAFVGAGNVMPGGTYTIGVLTVFVSSLLLWSGHPRASNIPGKSLRKAVFLAALALYLTACSAPANKPGADMADGGVESRHEAQIPPGYAGKTNPVPADPASIDRGAALYAANCASCHGDLGLGDGPASPALHPPPAPLAYSSQTVQDDYLFWRISEGGVPFDTSMPPWKSLEEPSRWDLVNYIRSLAD